MYVIGTAGHVDHGKSTLVQALTGIDPDRLREEKERGLTIDLGFAWLTLPSGREISIVDVPGHERFIKNMLAGAGGVDLALLVVAADEGPMPQTREHLAILELLDVPAGLVVITKTDLVEPEYVELVEAELEETLKSSWLASAPIIRVSATTGQGLATLTSALDDALDGRPPKRDVGKPRLPVDRAFAIQGFGLVVTGTLVDGSLEVGSEVEFQPGRIRARIRGLQRHKTKVNRLLPGTRAAVNLSGVRLEDVKRGMVVGLPGTIPVARAVDVHLRGTEILSHPLQHDAGVTFLAATAESEAKLRLLDRKELLPGEEGWAQLVLTTPVAVSAGDHCVVRTANETAAGGRIVTVNPRRHRLNDPSVIDKLMLSLEGTPEDRLRDLIVSGPCSSAVVAERLSIEATDAAEAAEKLTAAGEASERRGLLVSHVWLDAAISSLLATLEDYQAEHPLRGSTPREHARAAVRLDSVLFDLVVEEAVNRSEIEQRGPGVAVAGHEPSLTSNQKALTATFLQSLRNGGFSPPTDAIPEAELLAYLTEAGIVEATASGVVFDRERFDEMKQMTLNHLSAKGSITLAETRDLFGTSRKYAQAFLEHLDSLKLTRRTGDSRVALSSPRGD